MTGTGKTPATTAGRQVRSTTGRPLARLLHSRAGRALATSVVFLVVIWALMLVNALSNYTLTGYGVEPREIGGLRGILFAPFLHVDVNHLTANTPACAVLLFLVALSGQKAVWWSSICTVVVGGAGIWLTGADNTVHVGSSVLIYGWTAYLVLRGFFARNLWQILLGLVVAVVYAGLVQGLVPGDPGVSWQGHLFGAVGGGLAALVQGRRVRGRSVPGDGGPAAVPGRGARTGS